MDIQERFEHLNLIQEAVFVLSGDREILFGNTVASNHFGEHRLGQDFVQLIRNPQCLGMLTEMQQGRKTVSKTISFSNHAKGVFNVHVSQFTDILLKERLLLVSLRDVSETRQVEEMRSDFVANVSHELRSPLSTISGFIETLKGAARDDPPARERFLDLMEKETDRMVRLIADLLSLSKVEAVRRQRPTGKVDLEAIIKTVQTSLSNLSEDQGKLIKVVIAKPIAKVPGHQDQLIQVVQNLLENALKYSDGGETVTIRMETEDEVVGMPGPVVAIHVQDQGQGIARQHLARLTERFYRVDTHRSRNDGGTGLGLAIVKHIVQRHRGRLKIKSEPGKGSTFTVLLPCS